MDEDAVCLSHSEFRGNLCSYIKGDNNEAGWRRSGSDELERWTSRTIHHLKDGVLIQVWSQPEQKPLEETEADLKRCFIQLTEKWMRETVFVSSLHKKVMHPAYQRIIGLGPCAVPLILRELQRTRGHWLWALNAITGEDPAPPTATYSEAVDAWLKWGKENRYL